MVFHDPELTFVYATADGVMFVQWIAADSDDAVNTHLAKLPVIGWKRAPGMYISGGGEHVLFESLLTAAANVDPQHERPQRTALALGSYALEEYGIWKPDDRTELVLARLVRI